MIAIALLFLSGCSVLPKTESLTIYRLPGGAFSSINNPAPAAGTPWSLRVATPYSTQIVDNSRILVMPKGSEVSAYSGVRWGDASPVLLRNRLAGAFRADGRFASVVTDDSNFESDLELGGDLAAYQVEYKDDAPIVHIRYDATLAQPASNRVVATHRFEVFERVKGKDAPEVVEAFGVATDRLAMQVVDWTLQRANRLRKRTR